jgi:protein SCO1/2
MRLRSSLLLGCALIAAGAAGFALFEIMKPDSTRGPASPASAGSVSAGSASTAPISVGGPFALTDHTGKRVTEADYRGRVILVFFGYTYCPDVCPATLNNISDALRLLGDRADEVAPLFISVDDGRDDLKRMAEYVAAFDRRVVGLVGSAEEIAAAAKAYRIYYAKREREAPNDYLMDHSAYVYVMDRDGRYVTHLRATDTPEKIAETVRPLLDRKSAP